MKSCLRLAILALHLLVLPSISSGSDVEGIVRVHFDESTRPDLSKIRPEYHGEGLVVCVHVVVDSIPGRHVSAYHIDYEIISDDSSVVVLGGFHPSPGWTFLERDVDVASLEGLSECEVPTSVGYWRVWLKHGLISTGFVFLKSPQLGDERAIILADSQGHTFSASRVYHGSINVVSLPPTQSGGFTRLTEGEPHESPGGFVRPFWSPDGSSLAMTDDERTGIWVMRSDGSGLRLVAIDNLEGHELSWSPDSRYIAYRIEKTLGGKRHFAIKVIGLEDETERLVMNYSRFLGSPRWVSREGTVAFARDRSGSIAERHAADLQLSRIGGEIPRMVATTTGDLHIVISKPDGSERKVLSGLDERCFDPILSPDAEHVCYVCLERGGSISIAKADGTDTHSLGYGSSPCWSPDGSMLAFEVTTDDGHRVTGSELYVVDLSGERRVQITDTPDLIERWPCWSPDGGQIAFTAQGDVYVLEIRPGSSRE